MDVDDLPYGWEAFATNDADRYFCFPQVYYCCRALDKVQWEKPEPGDALEEYAGKTINGKKPYEKGDEFIPNPPPSKPYDGALADANYIPACEDPEDVFQPDVDMFEAVLECDLERLQTAIADGADTSLANHPWGNTPLHLVNSPYFWDLDTMQKEKDKRLELTQYMVRLGADLDAENIFHCRPVDLAHFHGYTEAAAFLEQQGSLLGWFGAAYTGNLERIKELLSEGQDIDLQGRYKRTAFAEAHLRGHWHVEIFLVQQGCSRELWHPEFMKFNPGGAALPRGNLNPKREKAYYRDEDPVWYDDMMEKRFPGYLKMLSQVPKPI